MGQTDPTDDQIVRDVELILDELVGVALGAAGGTVLKDVEAWWRGQYRAKFFYAIRMKKRTYASDKDKLRLKAEELGRVARALAGADGAISPLHAAIASFQVDCPPTGILEDWCN